MVIMLLTCGSNGQNRLPLPTVRSVELAIGVGRNDQTVAISFENNFQIGKQKRLNGFLNNRFHDVPKGWGIAFSYHFK